MGIVKSAADLLYTFRFLKLLVTPFEETDAYKAGIIDENGQKRRDFNKNTMDNRKAYEEYYTPFHRLVYNVKRFLSNAPGGSSRLASYAAALYLIRENFGIPEEDLKRCLNEAGYDTTDLIAENNQWFVLEDQRLSPGIYRSKHEKCLNNAFHNDVRKFDKIRVEDKAYPIGEIFGINIYEAIHMPTRQKIYITAEEILK
jgi:hypothetical protein